MLFNYYIPTTTQHDTEVPELGRTKLAVGQEEFQWQKATITPEWRNLPAQVHPEGSVTMLLSGLENIPELKIVPA